MCGSFQPGELEVPASNGPETIATLALFIFHEFKNISFQPLVSDIELSLTPEFEGMLAMDFLCSFY